MIELALRLLGVCFAVIAFHYIWKSLFDPAWLVEMSYLGKGDMDIRSVSIRNHEKRWIDRKRYAYVVAVIVGTSIIAYWIGDGALTVLPEQWGTIDEEGRFLSYRYGFSILLAGICGLCLPSILFSYAKRRLQVTEKK